MAVDTKKGVPGVPLSALNAIQDQNTRTVLQAIVDGWNVRNGNAGDGESRFVTKAELSGLNGITYIGGLAGAISGSPSGTGAKPGATASQIDKFINDMEASIMETALWKDLGTRIELIDKTYITERLERIAEVQKVADSLAAETDARIAAVNAQLGFNGVIGSKINTLESTSSTQATVISGLTTRVGNAESTITNLQTTTATQATVISGLQTKVDGNESKISNLQTTAANHATQLTTLTTKTNNADSIISNLQTTTANQATSLTSLTTRVTNTETGLVTAQSNISTLQTTTANQATQLTTINTQLVNASGFILGEQTTRVNNDNALATAINTIWSNVGGNQALVQQGSSGITNNTGAVATYWNQLQAAIENPLYNPSDPSSQKYLSSAAILNKADVAVSQTGEVRAQWGVKIDNNGYISGFGLLSEARVNENPYSDFIVRADRFSIGSPATPRPITGYQSDGTPIYADPPESNIPFMVQTTNETLPDGNIRPAGVYIKRAMIRRADIGTLFLDGEAVTKTRHAQAFPAMTITTSYSTIVSVTLTIPTDAGNSSVAVNGVASGYPSDSTSASYVLGILVNGSVHAEAGVTVKDGGVVNAVACGVTLAPGTHTVSLGARTQVEFGAATKALQFFANILVQAAYR